MIFWKKPEPPKKTASMFILGVCAFGREPSAAMLKDNELIFEASEASLTGKEEQGSFPVNAVTEALAKASEEEGSVIGIKDLKAVAFYEKPLLKYGRFLETWLANAPGGIKYFMASAGQALLAKRASGGLLKKELAAVSWGEEAQLTLYPEFLLSSAASAFYLSPFEDAAVLVLDGPGEWGSAAIALGSGEKIKILKEIRFPDSPDLLCSALAGFAGLDQAAELFNSGAVPVPPPAKDYAGLIKSELAELREDGSLKLNTKYFVPAAGMAPDYAAWTALFGLPPGAPGRRTQQHGAFAAAARQVMEEAFFNLAAQAKRLTGSKNLCLAGESPLNLAARGKLKASGIFSGNWARPPAPAAGRAAGAALSARYIYFGARRVAPKTAPGAAEPPPAAPGQGSAPRKQGLPDFLRLYFKFYFTIAAPAMLRRLKGETGPLNFGEPASGTSFYATRNHIYTREDLQSPD